MRFAKVLCLIFFLSGLAAAQATIIAGTAGNWAPAYGVYLAPYVPLVVTPSVTLSTVSPSAEGAGNATFGLVAGATNSTLSSEFIAAPPVGVYSQPVWYGPTETPEVVSHPGREGARRHEAPAFDFVSAGVAPMHAASAAGSRGKASRTYTNSDIDRINQSNGTVKYDSKTEHI